MVYPWIVLILFGQAIWASGAQQDVYASGGEQPGLDLTAVIISANAEWAAVRKRFPGERYEKSPFGEYFLREIKIQQGQARPVLLFQGGWGKVSAAAR